MAVIANLFRVIDAIAAGAAHQGKDLRASGVTMGAAGGPIGAFGFIDGIAIVTGLFGIRVAIPTKAAG